MRRTCARGLQLSASSRPAMNDPICPLLRRRSYLGRLRLGLMRAVQGIGSSSQEAGDLDDFYY